MSRIIPLPFARLVQRKSVKNTAFISLLVLMVITGAGTWGLSQVEREIKTNLKNQMTVFLDSTVKRINQWARERAISLESTAGISEVRKNIIRLIKKTSGKELTREQLLNLPEHQWLRKNLGRITRKYEFTGFVLIDSSGKQVAALLDEPVGRMDLSERSDFIERALNGNTVVSVPFASEVPLPDIHGHIRKVWPTMFVATPVRNDQGQVVAVLSFRLRPEVGLSNLLKVRPGTSGETYAFDSQGRLISTSRFESQLRSIGLIPNTRGSTSILNLEIRDPGGNMTRGYQPELPRSEQPLTRMAHSALNSQKYGWDVDGYNNYRGVPVVGAWTWLEHLNFGLALEIEVTEAHAALFTLNRIFLILFGMLLTIAVLALVLFYRKVQAEQEKIEERIQTEELARRMESIFKNTIDGIIILDEKGIIESFNPAAENIFGYPRKEVVGKNIKLLMPEPFSGEHDGYLEQYKKTGKKNILDQLKELIGLRKDGSTILIELAASVIPLAAGIKFTGIIRDITDRKRLEQAMALARKEAETASQAKTEFLSQMSHELRTPMNAVLGFSQILDSETEIPDPTVYKDCVKHILDAGKHLMQLINDILDLSQIETGGLRVSLEPTELAPLVREVLTLSEPLTASLQVKLIDDLSYQANPMVRADRLRLRQVLLNLVANAIKYNREQGAVSISCETHGEDRLRISVADTGIGIAQEDQKILFQPFTRLQNNETTIDGTGIGLTICQQLMELMNGTIDLQSEPGKGSTFTIELPLNEEPSDQSPNSVLFFNPDIQKASPSHKHDMSILYVEDNPANMMLVKHIMQTHRPDVELLTTPNGPEGLDLARKYSPDLILLDINLPGMSGLEMFQKLKQSPKTKHTPIVAISSNAMKKDIQKTLDLGFDRYLTKPIVLDEFKDVLNHYLGPRPSSPAPHETEAPENTTLADEQNS